MLKQWETRNLFLPRLRRWIERVVGAARGRDERARGRVDTGLDKWEICAGCACFKEYSGDWTEGRGYEGTMDGNSVFECWDGGDGDVLRGVVLGGLLCESCSRDWGVLKAETED